MWGGGEAHTRQMTLVSAKEEADGEDEDPAAAGSETTTSLSIAARTRCLCSCASHSISLEYRRRSLCFASPPACRERVAEAGGAASFLDCSAVMGTPCAGPIWRRPNSIPIFFRLWAECESASGLIPKQAGEFFLKRPHCCCEPCEIAWPD